MLLGMYFALYRSGGMANFRKIPKTRKQMNQVTTKVARFIRTDESPTELKTRCYNTYVNLARYLESFSIHLCYNNKSKDILRM